MLDPSKLKFEENNISGRNEITMIYDRKNVWTGPRSALPKAMNDFIMKSLSSVIKEIQEIKTELQSLNQPKTIEYEQLTVTPSVEESAPKTRKTKTTNPKSSD